MQIVVLGMHCSGTGQVTRLVNLMGANIGGAQWLLSASDAHPDGAWERMDVVAINDRILESGGSSWIHPSEFDSSELAAETRREYDADVKAILNDLGRDRPAVINDPRFSLTLPIWRPLFSRPVFVCVWRDPVAVVSSLRQRDPTITLEYGLALWERYCAAALQATRNERRVGIVFDDLCRSPEESAGRLTAQLREVGATSLDDPGVQELAQVVGQAEVAGQSDRAAVIELSDSQQELWNALETDTERGIEKASELAIESLESPPHILSELGPIFHERLVAERRCAELERARGQASAGDPRQEVSRLTGDVRALMGSLAAQIESLEGSSREVRERVGPELERLLGIIERERARSDGYRAELNHVNRRLDELEADASEAVLLRRRCARLDARLQAAEDGVSRSRSADLVHPRVDELAIRSRRRGALESSSWKSSAQWHRALAPAGARRPGSLEVLNSETRPDRTSFSEIEFGKPSACLVVCLRQTRSSASLRLA